NAVPDLWAERFISKSDKDLEKYGLKEPEQSVSVTRADGKTVTVLVGKKSREERRMKMVAPPPGAQIPPRPIPVIQEYRFARLQTGDKTFQQVFEVKADKLKDLLVSADPLRDPKLARFKTEDVRRVEVKHGAAEVVLVKEKEDWQLEKPAKQEAKSAKVTELLDKLSALEAQSADILNKAEKAHGLDKPSSTIKLTVEEEAKGKKA